MEANTKAKESCFYMYHVYNTEQFSCKHIILAMISAFVSVFIIHLYLQCHCLMLGVIFCVLPRDQFSPSPVECG